MVIREAAVADIPRLVDVHYRTWLATYPKFVPGVTEEKVRHRFEVENGGLAGRAERWHEAITHDPTKQTFVAVQAGQLIGFILAVKLDEQVGRIGSLYVLPEAQHHGAGSQLMQQALKWLQADKLPVKLEVAADNQLAIHFYEHHGFVFARQLPPEEHRPSSIVMTQNEMIRPPSPL